MGSPRLFVVLLLLAAAGGCASTPPPQRAALHNPTPPKTAPADLDTLAYARATAGLPKTAAVTAGNETNAPPGRSAPPPGPSAPPAGPPPPNWFSAVAGPGAPPPPLVELASIDEPYRLDSGDRLRIVVFGQDGLTNSYVVDPAGMITMPLISAVRARGLTTAELSRAVAERLRGGFIREPHVAIEVEIYRPFFILGEITFPGQYAFVPRMTAESAIAIAGGFTPRAYRQTIKLERPAPGGVLGIEVPLHTLIRPGDTIVVTERWF